MKIQEGNEMVVIGHLVRDKELTGSDKGQLICRVKRGVCVCIIYCSITNCMYNLCLLSHIEAIFEFITCK